MKRYEFCEKKHGDYVLHSEHEAALFDRDNAIASMRQTRDEMQKVLREVTEERDQLREKLSAAEKAIRNALEQLDDDLDYAALRADLSEAIDSAIKAEEG